MHKKERLRTSNTGRLSRIALNNSDLMIRGVTGELLDPSRLVPPNFQSLLLFPAVDSVELTPEFVKTLKGPINLIVPDGNWRQASRVKTRVPCLFPLTKVRVSMTRPTQYRLRREPRLEGLATFEAIARAMGMFEGAEVEQKLEEFFLTMVERLLWARRQISAKDCRVPIPQQALDEVSQCANSELVEIGSAQ